MEFIDEGVALGFKLNVTNLKQDCQPIQTRKNKTIAFNGKIYNYKIRQNTWM